MVEFVVCPLRRIMVGEHPQVMKEFQKIAKYPARAAWASHIAMARIGHESVTARARFGRLSELFASAS
jgi:hypothetical protein